MPKQTPVVEWTIVENDAEWERLRASALPDRGAATNRPRGLQHICWGLTALFLLLVSVSSQSWRSRPGSLPQPTADVQGTAQAVLSTVAPGRDSLVDSILTDQAQRQLGQEESSLNVAVQTNAPAAHGAVEFSKLVLRGDRAVVSIVTAAEHGAPAYRQTLFYQRTSTGWLRTEPNTALWGPVRSLETASFIFYFRENDAQTVAAVASQIETLYTTLQRNFGLPLSPDGEKLMIDVRVSELPGTAPTQVRTARQFTVPSPAVYQAPVELTDTQLLAQSIVLPLLDHLLAQVIEQHRIGSTWQPLLNGLRLWQIWELDLPLAVWRREVVQWVYSDVPTKDSTQMVTLPMHYAALCRSHQLWMPTPWQLRLPLGCHGQDQSTLYATWWQQRLPPTHLAQLAVPVLPYSDTAPGGETNRVTYPGQTVVLATLIEYAVATYGRERLPALVTGLGQYDSWETLIPAVYAVAPGEFETGWQAYLVKHYGVDPATIRQ